MKRLSFRTLACLFGVGVSALATRTAHAQSSALSRFWGNVDGGADFLLGGDPSQRFGPGGHLHARLGVQLFGPLSVQAGVGNWWFVPLQGAVGRMTSIEGGLKLSFPIRDSAWGGPVVDANVGAGFTGDLVRLTWNAGVGWEFRPLQFLGVGPVLRYTQIFQPDDQAQPDDAVMLSVGVGITLRVPPMAPPQVPPRDLDADRDGVMEEKDRCPQSPEDLDHFEDDDGCPEADNDGDGIEDVADRCPNSAEVRNGFEDDDGCPDVPPAPPPVEVPPVVAEPALVALGDRVQFATRNATLTRRSRQLITRVCSVLHERLAHPSFRLEIVGHADERGTEEFNYWLSDRRAHAVADAVEACGVPHDRVTVRGVGHSQPLCTGADPRCHQGNRRVEFLVRDAEQP